MSFTPNCPKTLVAAAILSLLTACSSSDSENTTDPNANPPNSGSANSQPSVDDALVAFPNQLLPRFALSHSEVTANEVYRRIDYLSGEPVMTIWGVEGASDDDSFELEAMYAEDGTLLESARTDILDVLPAPIDTALRARYPDASINEIERTTSADAVVFAILLDTAGEEVEANYDDAANFLHEEDVEEREAIPASILAVADALQVALPDAEWEISTFADGRVEYAVEYESDAGQSLTIVMDTEGNILRAEHEDALENLSDSDTVEVAVADFPTGIEADFGTMFSEVSAAEIFRRQDFSTTGETVISYGIEGVSADESLEIEALYTPEVVFLEQERGALIGSLPATVETTLNQQFPGAVVDEIVEVTNNDGMGYSVVFELDEDEQEANFDAAGSFVSLEKILEESDIPVNILTVIGDERVILPIVEFEEVSFADGTIQYGVEYENDDGDSISYSLDSNGRKFRIEHEAALGE